VSRAIWRGIPVVIQPLKVAQIVSGGYETMKDEDPPKAQAVEREVRTITDAFERLLDMGVPAMRIDLIIEHIRNKYGYKSKNKMIQ
jgi:hypothetical protein